MALSCLVCFYVATPGLQAQEAAVAGSRFFRTEITRNDEPYLAQALYNDPAGNTVVLGAPLVAVISKAYDVPEYRIVDGPEWIRTPHLYDITAAPPPAFVNSNETLMLQNLLKDQFGFAASNATRDITALTFARDDAHFNLEPVADNDDKEDMMKFRSRGSLVSVTFTLDELALAASKSMHQSVINLTGLQGRYRFSMDLAAAPTNIPSGIPMDQTKLVKLIMENAGLRTEQQVLPMEVLVVERVEHPKLAD